MSGARGKIAFVKGPVSSDSELCSVSAQGIELHLTGTFKCRSPAAVNRELAAFRAEVTAADKFLGTV